MYNYENQRTLNSSALCHFFKTLLSHRISGNVVCYLVIFTEKSFEYVQYPNIYKIVVYPHEMFKGLRKAPKNSNLNSRGPICKKGKLHIKVMSKIMKIIFQLN
jgi:hypothetical protein